MYAIAERNQSAGVGSVISRDQCRYWIGRDGKTTPCSDMAISFDTRKEAKAFMREHNLDTTKSGWFCVVKVADPE